MSVLLGAARRRASGRSRRQQELLSQRTGKNATNWSGVARAFQVLLAFIIAAFCAIAILASVSASRELAQLRRGDFVVSESFADQVRVAESRQQAFTPRYSSIVEEKGPDGVWTRRENDVIESSEEHWSSLVDDLRPEIQRQARGIAKQGGGDPGQIADRLEQSIRLHGSANLVERADGMGDLGDLSRAGALPNFLGSFLLLWWFAMMVCQGEGLELDISRKRHPMWEWLLSHPVRPGAVFFAEMLAPIAANPTYWGAPLMVAILYGNVYSFGAGAAAMLLAGLPIALSLACCGKALEIVFTLRLSLRRRGAALGLMSWFGYASMVTMAFGMALARPFAEWIGRWPGADSLPKLPLLQLFLGGWAGVDMSFWRGVGFCLALSVALTAASVAACAWGASRGLSADDNVSAPSHAPHANFGRDPMSRKEILWFMRDSSAVVQAVLIPLTIAGFQLFNFRALLAHAGQAWNTLCGAAIMVGAYFLWVLGPRSLASEGQALWLAMTWPRGLEDLLKAKARLWARIATVLIAPVLLCVCWLHPRDAWKVALAAVGWHWFARGMSERAVTLVTVVSESGEPQKSSRFKQWAAQMGMLAFALGVATQQWRMAVVGIVFSQMLSAALWQNFRARLPYLFDPWSEPLPEAPTLTHAFVGVFGLLELSSLITVLCLPFLSASSMGAAMVVAYLISAIVVWIAMSWFLTGRGVSLDDVVRWRREEKSEGSLGRVAWIGGGALLGASLGLLANAYVRLVTMIPVVAERLRAGHLPADESSGLFVGYAILAICLAPLAEEYLFRGLLYRALDREWGGWRAVLGAAAFFAILHPTLSWPPVFCLGAINCWIFRRSGRLAPAILLHAVYNAVVLLAQ